MFDYKKLPADIVKYLIIGAVIFGLVVIIPYNKLGVKDSIILAIILTLTVAVIETASILTKTATEKFDAVAPINAIPPTPTTPQPQPVPIDSQIITPPETIVHTIDLGANEQAPKDASAGTQKQTIPLYTDQPNANEKEANGSRTDDDVMANDLPYTDYHHIPLGDNYKPTDFEYGYSFLPPEKWYPTSPFPPVCVSEKRCPVCPTYTTGTPVDVKEWTSATKIMPPDGINTQYIKDKLNSGR